MSDTIFTKIINHEIPASIVYEDDTVLAFLDINPIHKGHTLIIPKAPSENVFDTPADTLAHMMKVAQKLAHAIQDATQCDGINLLMNNGVAAGQEVPHTHLHVVPRFTDDQSLKPAEHVLYAENEMSLIATTITAALESHE